MRDKKRHDRINLLNKGYGTLVGRTVYFIATFFCITHSIAQSSNTKFKLSADTYLLITQNTNLKVLGTIVNSGTIYISDGIVTINKDFTNNGSFTHNEGTFYFNGATQIIEGTSATAFNNITIAASSTTNIVSNNNTVYGYLKSDGVLNANGNITLLSTATQTALIDGSGTGSVIGNVIVQRYIDSDFGYRYISSPFTTATSNEFADEVNLTADFPPIYGYNEDMVSTGWVNNSDAADPLLKLYGYAINFGSNASPLTFDMTGNVNNGALTGITLYNHDYVYTSGYNLIGNPYPSPIDWDAATGWTRTNIDDAIYYFNPSSTDQYGGVYSSYVSGVSSDGIATEIIPALQGVFVHVSDGVYPVSASLSTNNNIRVNDLSPNYHKHNYVNNDPLIRICASFSEKLTNPDALVIRFNDSYLRYFEKEHDALKLLNTDNNVPNIYTISSDNSNLSISSTSGLSGTKDIIPLGIKTRKGNLVHFKASKIELFPHELNIYLHDNKKQVYHDLRLGTSYVTYLPAGEYNNRFSVVFTTENIEYNSDTEHIYAYSSGNTIYIHCDANSSLKYRARLYDLFGHKVWEYSYYGNGDYRFMPNVNEGIYILTITSESNVISKKIWLSN